MGLKSIVDNYGSTESGELARLYLANCYLSIGNYDEALKHFNSFDSDNDLLSASAIAGMASCYEGKGEYKKAASEFEKAAAMLSNQINTPDYLNSAAICYGKAGEKEKAVSILKRLKKEYPKSSFAREADRYISQFSIS
ncbi:MAG: tetratricopeptide repeat protein [Ignavibacteriales bacterium]|nr:tetratricopeptide repeat protein [Ignavibacteriales bacterium]